MALMEWETWQRQHTVDARTFTKKEIQSRPEAHAAGCQRRGSKTSFWRWEFIRKNTQICVPRAIDFKDLSTRWPLYIWFEIKSGVNFNDASPRDLVLAGR